MLSTKAVKFFKLAVNASNYKTQTLDISCRCPICGDSKTKRNSKRLHLYKKGNVELINCFNAGCPCENKTVYAFLRDFYPSILPQYKRETFNLKMESLKDIKKQKEELFDFSSLKNSDIVKKPLLFDLKQFFEPLDEDIKEYLENRNIKPSTKWYKASTNIEINKIKYNIKDFLIIPLYLDNLMYGFYSRSIKDKKFITFVSTVGYKVWNWYNINKTETTYVFEGIFDAISTGKDNIIANLGAKLPEERLKELNDAVFCLDNDVTGIKTSIKYAELGYKVFIMPSIYKEKDFNELKNNNLGLNISELIDKNTYRGISAITRLKLKL